MLIVQQWRNRNDASALAGVIESRHRHSWPLPVHHGSVLNTLIVVIAQDLKDNTNKLTISEGARFDLDSINMWGT